MKQEPVRNIRIDIREKTRPVNRMFQQCIGAGRANEGLRADWQKQLDTVIGSCGFRYIRMHGLLCDDMGVYLGEKEGRPVYNWQYIDSLYDTLLEKGIKPFVEIGFMPKDLASGPETIFWWKGNVTPPADYRKWDDLIVALLEHWTQRYGEDELATWYFEVWNEPNLNQNGFFVGSQADYFKLYEHTARAIKSVSARYRVGGPATAGNAWIPETIDFCHRNGVPIDFISTHHYAVTAGFLDEHGTAGTVLCPEADAMYREVRESRAQIARSPLPQLELHYTEWSSSYTPADPFHDSYHSAAFILDKVRNAFDAADSMSYWTFTDIFEESGPRDRPYHGGFGLINAQGIPKAAFYAYQFLNRLGDQELPCTDTASWITRTGKDVQALFWDFSLTASNPPENNQARYVRDLPPADKEPVILSLQGLEPGNYRVEVYQVGYRVNDSYSSYRDLGSPVNLSKNVVENLKLVNDGSPTSRGLVQIGADGVYLRSFPMRENDVYLVSLHWISK